MFELFTVEEVNYICLYDTSNRYMLIAEIASALSDFDDPDLLQIAKNVLNKLLEMSDHDFTHLLLCPEYEED